MSIAAAMLTLFYYMIHKKLSLIVNQITKTHHKIIFLVNPTMTKKIIVANVVVLFSFTPTKV